MAIDKSEVLEWVIDEGKSNPQKRVIVVAVAISVMTLSMVVPGVGIMLGIIGACLVCVSNAEVFLPVKFRLDSVGATRKCGFSVTTISWEDIKREVEDNVGIRLTPLERPSRRDAFRGVYLEWGNNRDAILAKIRTHRDGATIVLERGDDGGETR